MSCALELKANVSTGRPLTAAALSREVSTFISIHLTGEPYFACHNEFERINKHQLSGMYYNWKAECFGMGPFTHEKRPFPLLRTSAVPPTGIWPVNMEMNR